MKIAVIGSGTWGVALSRVLFLNGHRITVWSKFPEEAGILQETRRSPNLPDMVIPDGIGFTSDPEEAVQDSILQKDSLIPYQRHWMRLHIWMVVPSSRYLQK